MGCGILGKKLIYRNFMRSIKNLEIGKVFGKKGYKNIIVNFSFYISCFMKLVKEKLFLFLFICSYRNIIGKNLCCGNLCYRVNLFFLINWEKIGRSLEIKRDFKKYYLVVIYVFYLDFDLNCKIIFMR